jgi:aminoglycoside phosphotransferase (APT) family kinase protein
MPVVADRPGAPLATLDAPVAGEVVRVLSQAAGCDVAGLPIEVHELRRAGRVCRVRASGGGRTWSVIVKRLPLSRAHRSTQTTQRWLPAIGLGHAAPAVLGAVAPPGAGWVWHLYEDAGDVTLRDRRTDRRAVDAAVALIAALHVRGAGHPLVPECRAEGQDFGFNDYLTGVEDARRLLEALRDAGAVRPGERARVHDALRAHLDALRGDAPHRAAVFRDAAGPETMLHGDLWTTNVAVPNDGDRRAVRLIDWDRAGAGPATYDLSTFLLRFPPPERRGVLAAYGEAVGRAGWRLPAEPTLNVLCDTAECARYADRVVECAIAILQDDAGWAYDVLAEVLRWFAALAPVIPEH